MSYLTDNYDMRQWQLGSRFSYSLYMYEVSNSILSTQNSGLFILFAWIVSFRIVLSSKYNLPNSSTCQVVGLQFSVTNEIVTSSLTKISLI